MKPWIEILSVPNIRFKIISEFLVVLYSFSNIFFQDSVLYSIAWIIYNINIMTFLYLKTDLENQDGQVGAVSTTDGIRSVSKFRKSPPPQWKYNSDQAKKSLFWIFEWATGNRKNNCIYRIELFNLHILNLNTIKNLSRCKLWDK